MITKTKLLQYAKSTLKFMIIITLFSLAIDYWRSRDMPTETIPPLAITTLKGDWVDIEKMSHDGPVLIYFWATWCPVCELVSPSIDWLSPESQVVSVAITSGENQRLRQYMNHKAYDFHVINDEKGSISRQWGVTVTPSIFIVKDGEVSSITTGVTTPMGLWLRLFFA
ncbi:protein disulfide oxidoreductase [Psychromonas hadalis]|uniref:protein disulfide oxidoreductase n=1 Tax=Psychromonas hadalis TaxID=211669 RepID=UPI0003B4FB37|nr:protein disulfide oxidoreductase [Psychromonas hadalis]